MHTNYKSLDYVSGTNVRTHIGSRYVILAKHWISLTDDGFM